MPRIPINIADTVGNTPMVRLTRLLPDGVDVELYGKLEAFNPGGSVKDRIGVAMLDAAERDGLIEPGRTTIVEATSGNTGIALAFCCAAKGYHLSIFLPQGMSREREALLRLYGAQVEIVESLGGMNEAVDAARAAARDEDVFLPDQFSNPANPEAHRTGHGARDHRRARRQGRRLRRRRRDRRDHHGSGGGPQGPQPQGTVIGVEPEASAVLSGGAPGPHRIQGIGAGFVPAVLDREVMDEVMTCADDDAIATAHAAASREGILAGISCGAALWARARGRRAPRVARQAHRHRAARLGRALHLGAVLRTARRPGAPRGRPTMATGERGPLAQARRLHLRPRAKAGVDVDVGGARQQVNGQARAAAPRARAVRARAVRVVVGAHQARLALAASATASRSAPVG